MATAGQILGWVNIAFSIIGIGLAVAIAVFVSSHKSYMSLNAGDCFNRSSGALSSLVTPVSCDKPHQAEAVGTFDYPAASGATWPGAAGVNVVANPRCVSLALDYVGRADARLALRYFYPSRSLWDNGGRKVVCMVVYAGGGQISGSFGSGHVPATSG
jgi:hypothetical protein